MKPILWTVGIWLIGLACLALAWFFQSTPAATTATPTAPPAARSR